MTEGGLNDPPLPTPKRSFTGQQAFSYKRAPNVIAAAFPVISGVRLQNVLDVRRMSNLVRGIRSFPADEVTVCLLEITETA
jgi:hypothetical protein